MITVGLIGLGRQMQLELIPALMQCWRLFSVVSLCDINKRRLLAVHKQFPKATIYRSYKDLITMSKPHAVIVSLPHYLYYPVVEIALQNGVAVFKEKPFALNSNETKLILNLWEKTHIPIYTVMKRQFYGSYEWAKKHLSLLGDIYQYNARRAIPKGILYRGWRSRLERAGGGALIDLGYHFLHIIYDYFGWPDYISMQMSNKGKLGYHYEVEDAASLLLHHKHSLHGTLLVNCLSGMTEESFEIIGTEGRIVVQRDRVLTYTKKGGQKNKLFAMDSVLANAMAMREFYNANDETIQQNVDRNVAVMDMVDTAYKSIKKTL